MKEEPLLGAGPNTFSQSWLMHNPKDLNNTPFWNVTFPSGIGFLPTQIVSVGILGALAWLFFLGSFLLLGVRALSNISRDMWQRFSQVSTFFGSLFLWAINFVYTPSIVMLSLAFIMSALFVVACRTSGVIAAREIIFSRNVAVSFGSALVLVAVAIGTLTAGYHVFSRTASIFYFQKAGALTAVAGTPIGTIESKLNRAIKMVPQDIYYTALSDINLAYAQSLIENAEEGKEEETREVFQTVLQKAISSAQLAVSANPSSYSNWIKLGQIYSSLAPAPFSMEGAGENARSAFQEARKRNPNSPEVPLLISVLELDANEDESARAHIEESLMLKNDYADAYYLLARLEIKQNNIAKAIRSVETSAVLAANNSGLFFQLGLLRYENGDYLEAARALSKALEITPQYANAQYFLGLALEKLGRTDEAISAFEGLVRTNPDNEELPKILANIKEGKEPLDGLSPESTGSVESQTPPISE
jgi:tetratricopeptide (TPR) repeat protein